MQVLPLFAGLCCVVALAALEHRAANNSPAHGLYFALTSECPADMEDDRRVEVVALSSDGKTYLNDAPVDKSDLRAEIASRMKTRNTPIIYVRGDGDLTYGDFLSFASGFVDDTPSIMVALATTSQAGRVDPAERNGFWSRHRWKEVIPQQMRFGYCLPSQTWNTAARGMRAEQ